MRVLNAGGAVTPECANQCLAFGMPRSAIRTSDHDVHTLASERICDRDSVRNSSRRLRKGTAPIHGHSEMQAAHMPGTIAPQPEAGAVETSSARVWMVAEQLKLD